MKNKGKGLLVVVGTICCSLLFSCGAERCDICIVSPGGDYNASGFIETAYDEVVSFCTKNSLTYSYISSEVYTEDGYVAALNKSVTTKASLIFVLGANFKTSIVTVASEHTDYDFVILDAAPVDADGEEVYLDNVRPIVFEEEDAGFLAGFAAVKEGYKNLGFIGGQMIDSVVRFGLGFIFGANYAYVGTKERPININVSYRGSFEESDKEVAYAKGWYNAGTEVIFACAGGLNNSVFSAAEQTTTETNKKWTIGVDTDQSELSTSILTSAIKNISYACYFEMNREFIFKNFSGGSVYSYGVTNNGVSLATSTWRFSTFSVGQYEYIYNQLKDGDVRLSIDPIYGMSQDGFDTLMELLTHVNISLI